MRHMQRSLLLKLFATLIVAVHTPNATKAVKTTQTTVVMGVMGTGTGTGTATGISELVSSANVVAANITTSEPHEGAIKPTGIIKPTNVTKTIVKTRITQANSMIHIQRRNNNNNNSNNIPSEYENHSTGSTVASGNVTAGFITATTAAATATSTATATTFQNTMENVQEQMENLNTTTAAATLLLNIESLNVSDIDHNLNLPEPLNMSFHEYCLANRESFADLLTIVLYSIVCIVGLFGNTLVIYVVLRFSKMQTVTNIYILNLAIADECFLIGIPFLLYTMRICSWTFGEYMCKAYMVSTSITQFTSSIFLLIMSADRFIAVCHPIASPRYRTIRIAKLVSAIAWLTSAVLMLPVILFASTITQEDGIHHSCNIKWPEAHKHTGTTFILYTFFLGFAAPLCFILCFYYLVIKKLHAVGRKHKSKEKKRSHRKVTRLVLTVITVYVLCWLPQWISQVALINSTPGQSDLSRFEVLIFLLLGCLAYSNSAMNPILYAFLSDNFRKSFSKAFTCMAGHEVNAQLQIEPSVFTKHGGSRRRASKRLVAQTTTTSNTNTHTHKSKAAKSMLLLSATPGNNNSSPTTSSTTTQAEKHAVTVTAMGSSGTGIGTAGGVSTGCGTNAAKNINKLVTSLEATKNGLINSENIVLVLVKQETVCTTFVDRDNLNQLGAGSTLQTDL